MCKNGCHALNVNIRQEEKACRSLGTVLLGSAQDADRNPKVWCLSSPSAHAFSPADGIRWASVGKGCSSDPVVNDEILK